MAPGHALPAVQPAPSSNHLAYLDGWRGLAIAFLLLGHFYPVPGINFGAVGVNLFFVLSGLLMGQLLFVKATPIPVFYRRRISRIVPAHTAFIGAVLIFFAVTNRPIGWTEAAAALMFVNNYFPVEPGETAMPFGHIWSLSVEEHSYILLSIVAMVCRKHNLNPKWIVGGLAACFAATGAWYWSHYNGMVLDFDKWLRSEVSAYGIFMSAFLLLLLAKHKVSRLQGMAAPAFLILGIGLHWWSIPAPIKLALGVGAMALGVNLLAGAPAWVTNFLSLKPLQMLGLWSFSIYLWQQPFYLAARKGSIPVIYAVVAAVTSGVLSYYFLERPVRRYLNRTWGQPGHTMDATLHPTK